MEYRIIEVDNVFGNKFPKEYIIERKVKKGILLWKREFWQCVNSKGEILHKKSGVKAFLNKMPRFKTTEEAEARIRWVKQNRLITSK